MTQIEEIENSDFALWKKFVEGNNSANISHVLEFIQSVDMTYSNCKSVKLVLRDGHNVKAIFPFSIVKSSLFGNRAISFPFLDVGGPLGEFNSKELTELINKLDEKRKIKEIQIRLNELMPGFKKNKKMFLEAGFIEDDSKGQCVVHLTDKEDMWKRFHKHTRNDIRKAESSNLNVKIIKDSVEISRFYRIYLGEMKSFGTPQHSLKFFKTLFNLAKENVIGFNCYSDKKVIGSLILFFVGSYAYVAFNVSNPEYRNLRPNDLLYWTTIQWAIEHGIKILDVGQIDKNPEKGSRAEGLAKFKNKWLGKVYTKSYFVYSKVSNKESSKKNGRKDSLKKFRAVWRRLPLIIIKIIGPNICAQLGL